MGSFPLSKRRTMGKNWILPEEKPKSDTIKDILAARGIHTPDEIAEFLSDKPGLTHDPFLMKGLREAAIRICKAAADGIHIVVYGDYDADGICSVSLLMEILGKLTDRVSYYIPSRFDEGYGLNKEALKTIRETGGELVITVDCGSVSYEEGMFAEEIGLEMIVTDHHNLNDQPVNCLLVNPKQAGCSYPERELSGCGVAFKVAQGLARLLEEQGEETIGKGDLNRALDLVAIATIGDIVPLTGENRTLVKYGLKTLNADRRPGLGALIRGIGLKPGLVTSDNVAYGIVPHLNAAGRMMDAETGVTLLLSQEEAERDQAVDALILANRERRKTQEEILQATLQTAEEEDREQWILVLDAGDAHEGITGIVAGKIKETYHKPTVIVTDSGDGLLKGTGRGIEGLDLYALLSKVQDLFLKFGGHPGACGFLMDRSDLPELRRRLNAAAKELYQNDTSVFRPKLHIDAVMRPQDIDRELIEALEKLEPFGHRNPKPIFCMREVVPERPVFLGEEGRHARFRAGMVDAILFQTASTFRDHLTAGRPLDLAGYLEFNRWNGKEKIQFVTTDLRWYNE